MRYIVTTLDSVPASTSGTGTITTSGTTVTGSGTAFLSQIQRGAYIVNLTSKECRIVESVESNTLLRIESAFSSELSGANLKFVSKKDAQIFYLEIENTGGTATTITNVAFASGSTYTEGHPAAVSDRRLMPKPVVVDGATSNCTVNITKRG